MISPPRDIFRPGFVSSTSFGAMDPITAALDFTSSIVGAVTGKTSSRQEQINAAVAQNPCAQRVQAQIAALGPKPIVAITKKQRDEKAKRENLEAQLSRLLANPSLCPELKGSPDPLQPESNTGMYVVGGVVLTAAAVALLLRKKGKKS